MEDVSEILREDTRDKKLIARRTTKTKPVMVLSERAAAKKSSTVVTVSLYDTIMPYEQFLALDNRERYKAILAYREKFSTKEIATHWGKSPQSVHDHYYRLGKLVNKSVKALPVMEAAEEIAPVVKAEEIYPFDLKIIREITGEKIQDYIVKLVDLFELENDLVVVLDLKRSGAGFFNINIKVDTTMPARQFADELISNIGLLPRGDIFLMSLCVKEKKKEST